MTRDTTPRERWHKALVILIAIVTVLLFIPFVNIIGNFINPMPDCYYSPEMRCTWACNQHGLNYSRVAQHEGARGMGCFCLNGTAEILQVVHI